MPNLGLARDEVTDVLAYVAARTSLLRKKVGNDARPQQ
jgi:hypothetical protein